MNTKIILSFFIGCAITFLIFFIIDKSSLFSSSLQNQNAQLLDSEIRNMDEKVQTGGVIEENKTPSIYADERFCTVKDIDTLSKDEYNSFLLSLKKIKRDTNFSNDLFSLIKAPQDCDFLMTDSSVSFSVEDHQECLVKTTLSMIFLDKNIAKERLPADILQKVPLLLNVYENVNQGKCDALKEIKEEFVQYCTGEKDYANDIQIKYQGVKKDICE